MADLFSALPDPEPTPKPAAAAPKTAPAPVDAERAYTADDIEVLEGLEPVRKRPGMYIGGTDDRALHHLAAEILDNAMDEAVAGHASRIEMRLAADGSLTVSDNGRGIPVDRHPRFPDKSALEVIFTTLHSGGKFSGKAYATAGGLHGVGSSVVNALAESLVVEVARDRQLYRQSFSRGLPLGPLEQVGAAPNRRGTRVAFRPDPDIFGRAARFKPATLHRMARAKAYLYRGVEIRWSCDPALLLEGSTVPAEEVLHFPNGLQDFLAFSLDGKPLLIEQSFAGSVDLPEGQGRCEWAMAWCAEDEEGFTHSYCNTVPTPLGGTHEAGLRAAITKSLRGFGELTGNKRAAAITPDDVVAGAAILLSVFIRDPQFQGQTKEKLVSSEAQRLVEAVLKDRCDLWLSSDPAGANALLGAIVERAEERQRRRSAKEMARKSATRKLRLPGKLTDCSRNSAEGTELFLVEGDSAGGSAKQARARETQAILPLRGKILNVASASPEKMAQNQELQDLLLALGGGSGRNFDPAQLRYERIVIMTDADVDGAHIASLLMTFFYRMTPGMIEAGRLFLAQPPLYRLQQGNKTYYARDDADRERALREMFDARKKVEISRFKGLGEMMPAQLKETTMDPRTRTLLRVTLPDSHDPEQREAVAETKSLVESLMGRKAELRFNFIQQNAKFVTDLDV